MNAEPRNPRTDDSDADEPVAALIDVDSANRLKERLAEQGVAAQVTDGGSQAQTRLGRRVERNILLGVGIATPIALLISLGLWLHDHSGVPALVPLFFVGLAVIFIGGLAGALLTMTREEESSLGNTALVMSEQPVPSSRSAGIQSAIEAEGGDSIDPALGLGVRHRPGRPRVD